MGKDAPAPPPAPDYTGAATAQGAANVETAKQQGIINNPNVVSPYGNQNVTFDASGHPTITQALPADAQAALNAQNQTKLGLANLGNQGVSTAQGVMGTPFSFGGPSVQTGLDTSGIAKMPVNAGTTGFDAIMSRLEPQMGRQQVSTETQLTNQGLRPGSEAWTNAMTDLHNQQNDQRTQAAAQGVNLDMSANQQGYGQALQSGQFGNTAQQQALAQAIQQRQLPLNEITALMSGSQIQSPQFQGYNASTLAPAPIAQAAGQQAQYGQGLYNSQVGATNAQNSGLYSLGGSALMAAAMFSDRRLKSNIERVGTHPLGIGVYEYDIFGKRERGVMADEVLGVRPEAVARHTSGFLTVDYGRL